MHTQWVVILPPSSLCHLLASIPLASHTPQPHFCPGSEVPHSVSRLFFFSSRGLSLVLPWLGRWGAADTLYLGRPKGGTTLGLP